MSKKGTPEESQSPSGSLSKPSYDARTEYYHILRDVLWLTKQQSILANHAGWYRGIREVFNMVVAYIDQNEAKKIRDDLDNLGTEVRFIAEYRRYTDPKMQLAADLKAQAVEKALLSITESIHQASKHMMLPTSAEEEVVLDKKKFLARSDL